MNSKLWDQERKITIKDFGNDKLIDSVDDLKKILEEDYKGRSIGVHYFKKGTGMKTLIQVSVDSLGKASRSYGTRDAIDFEQIDREINA